MTRVYNFIVRAFEGLVGISFLLYLFVAITTNSLAAVLGVVVGFVVVLGVWSVLMLILRSIQANGESMKEMLKSINK